MTLNELIEEKKGTFILYWFNRENVMVSKKCYPEIIDEHTVQLFDRPIDSMARKSLFCLLFEEQDEGNIYSINKGYLKNVNNVLLVTDSLDVMINDKRAFFRFDLGVEIMLMNARYHEKIEVCDMSYNGVKIKADFVLDIGEDVMIYDSNETRPVFIPGKVVYSNGEGVYGLNITGNYNHICEIVMSKMEIV